ncbi:STAS domain-containing protein [Kitasatospora fiedleri]|uniref:STAS domain-containing protein n=1 Tax=Kitasatospora fiedleri TaxID=2991545 RepID=UPI00249CCD2A|nr:STAS domain-containing protein [Kitasatospora fiedleri]
MDAQPGPGPGVPLTVTPLTVVLRHPPGALVVRPEGELDHDSVEPLLDALEQAVDDRPGRVVVDCLFCDSTGLNLLLRAHAAARRTGLPLLLAAPGRVVGRLLEITGADEVLAIHPTVEDALAADPGEPAEPGGPAEAGTSGADDPPGAP